MKATDFLKQQHEHVIRLLDDLAGVGEPQVRRRLLRQLAACLQTHADLEKGIFYPAIADAAQQRTGLLRNAVADAQVFDLIAAELCDVDPEAPAFAAQMTALERFVEHHVNKEETQIFALAERLGCDELCALGEAMAARSRDRDDRGRTMSGSAGSNLDA